MKKILSWVLAAAMVVSLACAVSALPENRLAESGRYGSNMPEADYHVLKTTNPPKIDGDFDGEAVWGTPIFSINGNDAFWYSSQFEYFQGLYRSWAITNTHLWGKTDGSVELIRNANFKGYARWDDTTLYIAMVVEGISLYDAQAEEYYFSPNEENGAPTWYGNGIQVAFWPEDPVYDSDAGTRPVTDADGNVTYEHFGANVGNEYLIAITDYAGVESVGVVTRGRYDDIQALAGATKKIPNDYACYSAKNEDVEIQSGALTLHCRQVYEMGFAYSDIHCSVEQGRSEENGGKGGIPFSVAFNVQGTEQFAESAFNGFQVGSGIFQQNKTLLEDSLRLVLEDADWTMPEHEHRGGEHLKNCSAQAKCTVCDERYGDFGDHYYLDGKCFYCDQCEVHVWNEESVWPTEGKTCTVCGAKFECEEHTWNDESQWETDGYKTCLVCLAKEMIGGNVLLGDLTGDGKVNASDAVTLARYLAKWDVSKDIEELGGQEYFMAAANINQSEDGAVNSSDAVTLSRFLAKWNNTGFSDDIIVRVQ